ncbi:hypothetical protein F3J23_04705 [Chryseobacterium sp. Tr-659]|uniref:DUF6268 family outer membrane beta-barrel protein n=1 Tax=Chryseobacterium sp. Tr-659 TaxID=2608340 RepID=UPI0014234EB4|nr:DUF6268 family outer membrane beta-barrel protein [Chryseobacterium sp. Tr-659]NIF04736.1 hypothetical protein [Chryseobacterium sp. Tr-659]
MKTLRRALVPLAILPFKNMTYAQKRDSIPLKVRAFAADKFPQARDFNLDYTLITPYGSSSRLKDHELPDNKVKSFQQVKTSANIYLIKKKSFLLTTSLNYSYTSMKTENPETAPGMSANNNFHYHSEALNINYFSRLFNKTAIYTASLSVDGSDMHFERLRGMVTASVVLKADHKIKMAVGIAGVIDPSTQIPVLPIFTYENRFNNGLTLDILLPKKVLIRKGISSNSRISLGTEINGTSFYMYKNSSTYEFRQTEINSGAIYEHYLGGNFIGTFKTGVQTILRARIFNKQESFKNYEWEANYRPSFYFNIGLSYNPFGKPKSK